QIAIFTGWQICKEYLKQKPETKLQDFLGLDATVIFNQSGYKPKVK
ncbi:MAG TPA: gliding motility protein GldB, partial [Chryseobacterium sp.]|nr:gliding motility protein GldB [Chryseobacterium sp.]